MFTSILEEITGRRNSEKGDTNVEYEFSGFQKIEVDE
jgi:hypothetical protein